MIHVDWRPEGEKLKGFALIAFVAFGALGGWIYLKHRFFVEMSESAAHTTAYVLWGLSLYSLLFAFVAPKAVLPIYYVLTCISVPIGFVLSHVIMLLIFYGLFTPIALVFRLMGRDVLARRFEPEASTYWVKREPNPDVRRYFRQF